MPPEQPHHPAEEPMDFPKVGGGVPRPPKLDAKTVENAGRAAGEPGETLQEGLKAAREGVGDSFERVERAGDSLLRALGAPRELAAAEASLAALGAVTDPAGDAGDLLDTAGELAERAARRVDRFVEDPVASAGRLADAVALGFGNAAVGFGNALRKAKETVREEVLDDVADSGVLDKGLGSEGVAHALGVIAGHVAERAGDVADDAAEAAAPVGDAIAAAAEAAGEAVGAVGGAVSDAADAVGDAAGAAWDALIGGGAGS
jgi:hypothetical protein